jgi:hypothetical protein
MEEMHRTHKEPVWGWVAVVADLIAKAMRASGRVVAQARPKARVRSGVTPWSPAGRPGKIGGDVLRRAAA